jgi:hypothetical protein
MKVNLVVKDGIKVALGLSDKEAKAINEVANEVARKEMQVLARQIEQKKFRPAASSLTKILKKMPMAAGKLAEKLGRWDAIKVLAEIGLKRAVTGGKVTSRLAEYFCEVSIPALRKRTPRKPAPRKRTPRKPAPRKPTSRKRKYGKRRAGANQPRARRRPMVVAHQP